MPSSILITKLAAPSFLAGCPSSPLPQQGPDGSTGAGDAFVPVSVSGCATCFLGECGPMIRADSSPEVAGAQLTFLPLILIKKGQGRGR
jgi:hypothetical protein